jgi:deoxyribodipyrimidine photo-lyase
MTVSRGVHHESSAITLKKNAPVTIFWFRRDLRLHDNAGLYRALQSSQPVLPLFIFDTGVLDKLENRSDARVEFILKVLMDLQQQLKELGSGLLVRHGSPLDEVFTNRDYEPYARERDEQVAALLKENGVAFHSFKDQVVFESTDVLKDDGSPYTIFTPYSRRWKATLPLESFKSFETEKHFGNFLNWNAPALPSLEKLNFRKTGMRFPPATPAQSIIKTYDENRDYPGKEGTTRLGVHLRFGTISIRELARRARQQNEVLLNELLWREFYMMILWHFPHVVHSAFKREYDAIRWQNNEEEFQRWCEGATGFRLVDAGMRELNATGYMHNRLRMITASFLTKDLLIDWRWGEAYFAEKLLDFELSSNNGGWQWAAGTGCDAAPYFRIFNPDAQAKKFDPDAEYIRRWVPEWNDPSYPQPIVDHKAARERCLQVY